MHYLSAIVLLLFVYLEISSNLEIGNLVVGLLIAMGVTLLVRPRGGPVAWGRLISSIWALVKYLAILMYDLIKSGIQVARIVLSRRMRLRPGIVAIPADCESERGTALSAHAITLTPGQLVVEMDEKGVMYTHCLDATDAEKYVTEAQQMRRDLLDKIFE
jgi:multicomponent Na+:H+ antiporter subunit E